MSDDNKSDDNKSDNNKKISLPIHGSDDAGAEVADADQQQGGVHAQIDELVNDHGLVLFMKGTPDQPMCGFSARASALVASYDQPFMTVNVLDDPQIRQGIKDYGDWPTIPQLYVGGELVGGSDIVQKMHQSGELGELIEGAD